MIWRTLGITPEEALNGTTALNMIALVNGASILRVHDVREAREVITLFEKIYPQAAFSIIILKFARHCTLTYARIHSPRYY